MLGAGEGVSSDSNAERLSESDLGGLCKRAEWGEGLALAKAERAREAIRRTVNAVGEQGQHE